MSARAPEIFEMDMQEHGATRKDQNFALTTTSTNADQSIGSYAPTNKKIYVIQAVIIEVTYTTVSTTAAHLGTLTIKWGASALWGPFQATNPSSAAPFGFVIPIGRAEFLGDGSTTINAICTPASVTSTIWKVTIVAYERGAG